jgi:hypothetical protein
VATWKWDEGERLVGVGRLKPKPNQVVGARAWMRFTVAVVSGSSSAAPKFKYQAKITGGRLADVDPRYLPNGLPTDVRTWPNIVEAVWMKKYQDFVRSQQRIKVEELKQKEATSPSSQAALQTQFQSQDQDQQNRPLPPQDPLQGSVAAQEAARVALGISSGVTEKDPELERQLFDENTVGTVEKLKILAKYLSGRLSLKPKLPWEVLEDMMSWQTSTSTGLFRAPAWSVWLKNTFQYPLKTNMLDDLNRSASDVSKPSLLQSDEPAEVFTGIDGEPDIGFPETRVELQGELERQLDLLERLCEEY